MDLVIKKEQKRLKVFINEILRCEENVDVDKISNRIKRKDIQSMIENSETFQLVITPIDYFEEWVMNSWNITRTSKGPIIKLRNYLGYEIIIDVPEKILENEKKINEQNYNDFENIIEQSKLLFLTGDFKCYKSAFFHINNILIYNKENYKYKQQQIKKMMKDDN